MFLRFPVTGGSAGRASFHRFLDGQGALQSGNHRFPEKGKEVFLFGTAGFGGSQEYFDKVLSSVQKRLGASNTVIGTYMCQGKMPQSVRERYVKMKNSPLPIPNVDKMIENFDTAVSHPDETDLQKLKYAVAQCIKR